MQDSARRPTVNIILTGFMGTGKTTVGRIIARRLGYRCIDIDEEIQREHGATITDLFERHGETGFRELESATIALWAVQHGLVISTGGGAVTRAWNMEIFRRSGIIVCLTASPETILLRTSQTDERPLLRSDYPLGRIRELVAARRQFYSQADITVSTDGKDPEEVAAEVLLEFTARTGTFTEGCTDASPALRGLVGGDMEKITVGLGDRSYDICIGEGLLASVGEALLPFHLSPSVAVISTPTVFPLYGAALVASLERSGFHPFSLLIPDGEEYKDYFWAFHLLSEMLKKGLDRNSCIVALGGGVLGDLAGFVASVYMRGISFVQVPTTLLAQVDSSVGGKTGVNHPLGKNLIGAFHQPRLVMIDPATLRTLPERHVRNGLAEVIKYGVIWDSSFFGLLEEKRDIITRLDPTALRYLIRRSCEIKAEVVSRDERESGLRAILNYGHTIGHAIEKAAGFGHYLHGEAVALGMVLEAELAAVLGLLAEPSLSRIRAIMRAYDLPSALPLEMRGDRLLGPMRLDKKTIAGELRFILPDKIGRVRIERGVSAAAIGKVLGP